jgi:small subunit ribosomal protein S15
MFISFIRRNNEKKRTRGKNKKDKYSLKIIKKHYHKLFKCCFLRLKMAAKKDISEEENIAEENEESEEGIEEKEKKSEKVEKEEKTEQKMGKPSWIKLKQSEIDKEIVELAKKGESPAKIGLILRDRYGIPKMKVLGRRISKILKDEKVEYRNEEKILNEKVEKLREHSSKNKHDFTASRALAKKLWIVNKIEKSR